MSAISWSFSPYSWAVLLVPIIGFCALYRVFFTRRVIALLAGNRSRALISGFSPFKTWFRAILLCVAAVCFACALFQPRWGEEETTITREGRDLLIAIDISRSMLAKDCIKSRLEIAKDAVHKIVAALGCERVGLLLFASSAWMQCPLTEDYSAVQSFVDMIDYDSVASGSTDITAPITAALDVYERMPSKKNKLLVLLTDGEDLVGNRGYIQQRAHEAGLSLFVIGIGTEEGAPIPCYDENGLHTGHITNEDGSVVISRLAAQQLRELVSSIGGQYMVYNENDEHVRTLIDAVMQHERELQRESSLHKKRLQYPYFLGGAFCALSLEYLL